jgi:rare lipoprotein A
MAPALLSACSSGGPDPKWGVSSSPRVYGQNDRIPKGGGSYKLGRPYVVGGRWYTPREQPGYDAVGIASWYGDDFHGRKTANGEIYDMNRLSAAHPTLPLPTYAYVTNLDNGRTVLVRINDRGPYVGNRMIDLSRAAAHELGTRGKGLGRVRVRYAGHAPMNGDDTRERRFLASQPWYGGSRLASTAPPEARSAGRDWPPATSDWSVLDHRRPSIGAAR